MLIHTLYEPNIKWPPLVFQLENQKKTFFDKIEREVYFWSL
jgi:hypothetical protein